MNPDFHYSFDLDGTLIDSIPLMKQSWENVDKTFSLGIGWNQYRKNLGLPFNQICKNLGIKNYITEIYNCYFNFNKSNIDMIKAMPGLESLINSLIKLNISWSIITSKPTVTTEPVLEKFGLSPRILITSDNVHCGKPSTVPSILLKKKLSKVYSKYIYVGDSIVDHQFAINSDFEFVEFSNDQSKSLILNDRKIINDLSKIVSLTF